MILCFYCCIVFLYFPCYRCINLHIRLFFWRQGGYRTGNIVAGSVAANGLWRSVANIGFFIPRAVGRFFFFYSMQLCYWLNRGAILIPSVFRLLLTFAMNFFFIGNLFNEASFSSFLNDKILYFRYGTLNKKRQSILRYISITRGVALLSKSFSNSFVEKPAFFRSKAFSVKFIFLIAKHLKRHISTL